MRTLLLITSLMIGGLFIGKGTDQPPATNAITKDWRINTDGLFSDMDIDYKPFKPPGPWHEAEVPPPICWVFGGNNSTNSVSFLKMPPTNLFNIELLDSQGKPVEKTSEGKMFGLPLTEEQVANWRHDAQKKSHGFGTLWNFYIRPNDTNAHSTIGYFSLRPVFQIKQPGEYTLHLRLRLIQAKSDSAGQLYFPMVWLPEATAKVQIRPEDIPQTNSVSGGP